MIADAELVAAVADRVHWRVEDDAVVYAPPGAAAFVCVRPVARPSVREQYHAAVIRAGVVESSIIEAFPTWSREPGSWLGIEGVSIVHIGRSS